MIDYRMEQSFIFLETDSILSLLNEYRLTRYWFGNNWRTDEK